MPVTGGERVCDIEVNVGEHAGMGEDLRRTGVAYLSLRLVAHLTVRSPAVDRRMRRGGEYPKHTCPAGGVEDRISRLEEQRLHRPGVGPFRREALLVDNDPRLRMARQEAA